MAAAFEYALPPDWPSPCSGLVVTRYGHAVPTKMIEVREAAHPVPDQAGFDATNAILNIVEGAGQEDLVVFLISGGASALLTAPALGVTLAQKRAINAELLASGAPIADINIIRSALSRVKGGRLAEAAKNAGATIAYAISDVPGDDPRIVGSGPVSPPRLDRTPIDIVHSLKIKSLEKMNWHMLLAARNEIDRYPEYRLIATPRHAIEAAAKAAKKNGVAPIILGDALEGEAKEAAKIFAGLTAYAKRIERPSVLLSGGEFTVTVRGNGRGGPNGEFLLALSLALEAAAISRIYAIACDTDGVDGAGEAGAIITPDTLERARKIGLNPLSYLQNNDAYGFFEALDDVVVTGPTLTNVNDFRAIYIP